PARLPKRCGRSGSLRPTAAICSGSAERHESALVTCRQSNRLSRPESDLPRVAARVAAGWREHDARAKERTGNHLRLVSERQMDRLPGFEGEARPHQCRDEEGAEAAQAPAPVQLVERRLVAELATAPRGLATAGPLVLSKRPVAGSDRRSEAAPGPRLLRRRTPTTSGQVGLSSRS